MRCSAYCTSSSYNLHVLFHLLKSDYDTVLFREAVRIIGPDHIDGEAPLAFFFTFGVAVFWSWKEAEEICILQAILPASPEINPHPETDLYNYSYETSVNIRRDRLILSDNSFLTKMAVSFGLAQSAKLTVFEGTINQTIENSKQLPRDLALRGKIFLSRKAISKKIGKLFIDKALVNLQSDILDEPDFFWEHPDKQPIYRDVFACFDIAPRTSVLNHKLTILGDLLSILNNQLHQQYSSSLEWTIICLIVIEVAIALLRDLFHLI
ncbi:MAG: RMD1 family protein [Victivallaceae bacterium]